MKEGRRVRERVREGKRGVKKVGVEERGRGRRKEEFDVSQVSRSAIE